MNCRFLVFLGHDRTSINCLYGLLFNFIFFEYQLLISEDVLPYVQHLPLRFFIDYQVCAEVLYCAVNIVLDIAILRCEFVLTEKLKFDIFQPLLPDSALFLF